METAAKSNSTSSKTDDSPSFKIAVTTDDSVSSSERGTKRSLNDDVTSHYPKALKNMFGALKCELCGVTANSTLAAFTHYKGKLHRKKVDKYLADNNINLDTLIKKPKHDFVASTCELCNVILTSEIQSLQHYGGKAHKKKLANRIDLTKVECEPYDETGRFGIGKTFASKSVLANAEKPDTTETSKDRTHFCSICSVFTTSEETLMAHVLGSKHKKKLASESNQLNEINSLAKYRTPSDYYYCPACDISANSVEQFLFHLKSKKHTNNKKKVDT